MSFHPPAFAGSLKKLIKNSDAPELLVKEPQAKRKRMKSVLFCRVPGCELKNFRFKTREALRSHTIRKHPLPEAARATIQEEDWVIVPYGEETKLSAQEALLRLLRMADQSPAPSR